MLEMSVFCPLGKKCEEIENSKAFRCAWFVKLIGKDPQSKNDVDEWGCAIGWIPIMLVEVAQMSRGTSASVISLRDETVKRQDVFNLLAAESVKRKQITLKRKK
jgi:hypothetical protein